MVRSVAANLKKSNPTNASAKTTAPRTAAKVAAPITGKRSTGKPKIAMFIDVDNAGISRENLLEILFYVNGKYQIETCRLYGYDQKNFPELKEVAENYHLTTIGKMQFKPVGQNCVDSRLLIDAYDCALQNAKSIDTIFVWCYPCDLAELFERMIKAGVSTAIIEHPIFDCKNKYVSQKIKIYSPYQLSLPNPTFGQIKNTNDLAVNNIKVNATNPEPTTTEQPQPTPPSHATEQENTTEKTNTSLSEAAIPVLPKRDITIKPTTIDETASVADFEQPKQPADDTDPAISGVMQEMIKPGESLADAISRRLNLPKINLDKTDMEIDETETNTEASATDEEDDYNNAVLDIMRKAGLMDDEDTTKELKYEDTIGDL